MATDNTHSSLYIGLMSGTSLDAIDAVLVNFEKRLTIKTSSSLPIPDDIRAEIKALNAECENDLTRINGI